LRISSARTSGWPENPGDKLLPTPATLASTLHSYAAEEDVRSGEILFWLDTVASLKRIFTAPGLVRHRSGSPSDSPLRRAAGGGRACAVRCRGRDDSAAGYIADTLHRGGPGRDGQKITLMTIGIAPCIVRDLALRASELPASN